MSAPTLDGAEGMLKLLNSEGKKHGLTVRLAKYHYEVCDGLTGAMVYEAQTSEDVACYFGRLDSSR
jgi:hypothetical protein